MKITIFLIALFIANEADNRGYSLFALVIILAALWEAFLRSLVPRLATAITKFIRASRRILLPRLLGKEKFQRLFNADGSPQHEYDDNNGLSLYQFFVVYMVAFIYVFAVGVDDIALFFARFLTEYTEKPLGDLILYSKLFVYIAIGGGAFILLCGAIIDFIFGKGTFRYD